MKKMTNRQRIKAAINGELVDRVPVSFFLHNELIEHLPPNELASYMIEQNKSYEWDFIKVILNYTHYSEAWGGKYTWDKDWGNFIRPQPVRETIPIKEISDLGRIQYIDTPQRTFAEQLEVTNILSESTNRLVPIIHTIYSPLTVILLLAGWTGVPINTLELLLIKKFMKEAPSLFHRALRAISETISQYASQAIRSGADGIMMTTAPWTKDNIDTAEYETFGTPYNLPIFESAAKEGASINILHICGENILFDLFSTYPIQIISYDSSHPRNLNLQAAMSASNKAIWGGLCQGTHGSLFTGPEEEIIEEVNHVLEQTKGLRFILGAGCNIDSRVPALHLRFVKQAVNDWFRNI